MIAVASLVQHAFVQGGICSERDAGRSASTLLNGRHLLISEVIYKPYFYLDAEMPSGYGGFDMDLLNAIAARLNFTYDIQVLDRAQHGTVRESWTSVMSKPRHIEPCPGARSPSILS